MSGRKSGLATEPPQMVRFPVSRAGRALLWLLIITFATIPAAAASQQRYALDQRFGSITFSVKHLGLFSSHGEFRRFTAHLVLDGAHPERTKINVDVDADSVDMAWQAGEDMLRSSEFLDVQNHPAVRFTSTSVASVSPDHYVVRGVIRIRGVAQPMVLSAQLTGRHEDAAHQKELADFVVTGSLRRSAFGMIADEGFISDRVKLVITARVELGPAPREG